MKASGPVGFGRRCHRASLILSFRFKKQDYSAQDGHGPTAAYQTRFLLPHPQGMSEALVGYRAVLGGSNGSR